MKALKKLRLISILLTFAMLCAIFPTGVVSNAQDAQGVVYQLCNTPLTFPSSSCAHEDTTVLSYPTSLGGDCTVKCLDCNNTVTFATSTGMKNWWNHDGSNNYSSPLTQRDYTVGEKLYLWIQDLDDTLAPDEKTITVTGSDGATFTETWTFMGYFTFEKPGVYTVTIADKYNPLVCFEYTMNVTGTNGSGVPEDDGSCSHTYKRAVTPATCLVQGYTTYTCSACGISYLDNYTDPIGHSYTSYLSNGDGALVAVCDHCDATDTVRDPHSDIVPSEATAYQIMVSLKDEYPEGMTWTNDNYYGWQGGIFLGGYGCAGFCFLLSDAIFGDLPARKIEEVTIDQLRVGDILRLENDSHSVSVLEVHDDYIVVAEGNYNSSIHWGRKLTAEEVAAADYYMTRYPEHVHEYINGTCVCGAVEIKAVKVNDLSLVGYTLNERVVTVTYAKACKVGYLNGGSYVAIAPTVNSDGSYSFIIPDGITEVVLAVKGDLNRNGRVNSADRTLMARALLSADNGLNLTLTAEEHFIADLNDSGAFDSNDKTLLAQSLLPKNDPLYRSLEW